MNLEFENAAWYVIFTYLCSHKIHFHVTIDKYSHFVPIPTLRTDNSGIVQILTLRRAYIPLCIQIIEQPVSESLHIKWYERTCTILVYMKLRIIIWPIWRGG